MIYSNCILLRIHEFEAPNTQPGLHTQSGGFNKLISESEQLKQLPAEEVHVSHLSPHALF